MARLKPRIQPRPKGANGGMNPIYKGRLTELADHLEALPPEQYDQENWAHDCGTPACIAAWAVFLFAPSRYRRSRIACTIEQDAQELLGLTEFQGGGLFVPCPYGPESSVTVDEAAQCLQLLVDTGDVDWDNARELVLIGRQLTGTRIDR